MVYGVLQLSQCIEKKVFFENETQCFVCLIIQQNPLSMFCVVSLVHLFLVVFVCVQLGVTTTCHAAQSAPCLMMIITLFLLCFLAEVIGFMLRPGKIDDRVCAHTDLTIRSTAALVISCS